MIVYKIIYITLVCLISVAAIFALSTFFPIPGNYKIMAVVSGSMEPAIKTGGIVVVKPAAKYNIGDVISFFGGQGKQISTTHRIISVETVNGQPVYTTKGDANNAADDQKISNSEIIGKLIFTLPYFGYLSAFVRQPMGFLSIVIVPSCLVIFGEAQNIWSQLAKKDLYKTTQKVRITVKKRTRLRIVVRDENDYQMV